MTETPTPRTWSHRLGEGVVLTVSMLIFRLVMGWLGLIHESFADATVFSLVFGAVLVAIFLAFDLLRDLVRRGRR